MSGGIDRAVAGPVRALALVGILCAGAMLAGPPARAQDGVTATTATTGTAGEQGIPFRISVDGRTVDESGAAGPDTPDAPGAPAGQRRADVGLSAVDVQVRFDGLGVAPLLNVVAAPAEGGHAPGETVSFATRLNYPRFVARGEIRIFDIETGSPARPVDVIPAAPNGTSRWTVPAGAARLGYVFRVYDDAGRFDQTAPLEIPARGAAAPAIPDLQLDRTAVRNIAVSGGAVTVYGSHVPAGYTPVAFGEPVPLDASRSFVVQRILPAGDHRVPVALEGGPDAGSLRFSRRINIPQNDWFYVALADITAGMRAGDDGIRVVRPGEYDEVYTKGRLAFYLKGKIKGEYLLTAAADTGTSGLSSLFSDLGARDTQRLLDQLDPDDFYPVYGDDSTMVEDAPTDGKFYVRLERGDSHVMWGNFETRITGTEFLRSRRVLYGARGVYRSEATTPFGARRSDVRAHAALPDTRPQRDEFLATGGSAYFLKRQDVVVDSEVIEIEVRDPVSGRVTDRRTLRQDVDYRIDYIQGVVILVDPLSWTTGTDDAVRTGSPGGDRIYMVAQYDFHPGAGDADDYALGARAEHWLTDNLRIGMTGTRETSGTADRFGIGVDAELRLFEDTFLRAELARSEGPGFGIWRSTDGGLTWARKGSAGVVGTPAHAWRVEGQADLGDLGLDGMDGTLGAYVEGREAGFSSLSTEIDTDQWAWGLSADLALGGSTRLAARYDDYHDAAGEIEREGEVEASWDLDADLRASLGVGYTELRSPSARAAGKTGRDGTRLDAGVRLEQALDADSRVYGFGQVTLDRRGDIRRNDRVGAGIEYRLTESLGVEAEVSYGTTGLGVLAGLSHDPNPDEHYYLGYRLDPDRGSYLDRSFDLVGRDSGTVVAGLRRKLDEVATAYAEGNYDLFGKRRTLTQSYGIMLAPDAFWTLDAGLVAGHVRDDTIDPGTGRERADFDRYAPSLGIGYVNEEAGIKGHVNAEVRFEDSTDDTRDQTSYMLSSGLAWQTHDDWRLVADFDAVVADAGPAATGFSDTRYVEASAGYAYRPVDNERLNALVRYTYLHDMPGNGQTVSAATGENFAPAQRSHILSADITYDLTPRLSVGAKYGLRYGQVRNRTDNGTGSGFEADWHTSTAHLGILRGDLHIVKNWDVMVEGRVLHMPEAQTTDYGALASVYRHFGDNLKLGIGYNFGRFSDDLRDLTLNDRGVFLNVVGKY